MCVKQAAICGVFLWVERCMTTDLYIGTQRRHLVAMAPEVADAEERIKAKESSQQLLNRTRVCLSDRFWFTKAGKSPCDLIDL